jgi:carboxyl-terminal processing protease
MKTRNAIVAVVIVVGSALLAPIYGPVIRARAASPSEDDLGRDMKSVAAAYALVEKNFADPVSAEKAIYQGAIPGMLHTLDPHSNFLDPAEYSEMQRRQRAQYFGVGMEITMDAGRVVVTQPFPGSPASVAGLRRGDIIMAVDDKDATGMDSGAVADMLRGPRGSQVKVTVKRDGASDYFSTVVTRGEIGTSLVDAFWLKPGVVYLGVGGFDAQNVSKDVEADLSTLGEGSVTGMVLDLRGNLGGLVPESVALAGRFLRNGQVVVSQRGRVEQERVYRAKGNPLAQRYPIVVLVDGRSASASEIVSGALQDHDRAWILGANTFGKGLVQAQFPLSEGAALLLTIAHYYTPSGRLIQRDYQHRSFYDYYFASRNDTPNTDDVKATDSGRKVYGGGGIMPDEKYPGTKYNMFQRRVASAGGPYSYPFFRFGNFYFAGKKPEVPAGWQPDNQTIDKLKEFLKEKQVPFTDQDITDNMSWLKDQIRWEFYFRAFDKKTADRARLADDPEVHQGIESLPKAEALLKEAQRTLARRQ